MKKWRLYEWSVILLFFLIPSLAIAIELILNNSTLTIVEITLKWVVFCSIGLRLGSSGLKQIIQPQFTASEIFNISDERVFPLVREIGFANISFSTIALISFFIPSFRLPSAIAGGLYFGLAGLLHILKYKASDEEKFAMITDIYIFVILLVLLVLNLRR